MTDSDEKLVGTVKVGSELEAVDEGIDSNDSEVKLDSELMTVDEATDSDSVLVEIVKVDSEMSVDEATSSDSVLVLNSTEAEELTMSEMVVLDSEKDDSVDDGCSKEKVDEGV